jgi:dolichol-phosphate mannosyltransferase
MIGLAADGVLGFSTAPLRFAIGAGVVMAVAAVGYGLLAIALKLAGLPYVPGYASLLVTITFLSGVQLMVIGMVGQYVARVYDEARGRPLYLIREAKGFASRADAEGSAGSSAQAAENGRPAKLAVEDRHAQHERTPGMPPT